MNDSNTEDLIRQQAEDVNHDTENSVGVVDHPEDVSMAEQEFDLDPDHHTTADVECLADAYDLEILDHTEVMVYVKGSPSNLEEFEYKLENIAY